MYEVQHLAKPELRDAQLLRIRSYDDDQPEITGEELRRSPHPEPLGYHAGCKLDEFDFKVAR